MDKLDVSPAKNIVRIGFFILVVFLASTVGYMEAGWDFEDAIYMVAITVFTVGYGEVRPIDTAYLHGLTMVTMILGCTGMIFFTGALAQFFTVAQLQKVLGVRRVQTEIEKLKDHTIICGFGRIGVAVAVALFDGGVPFLILEENERRVADAREAGYLCLQGDATNEVVLAAAGITRARTLATVLPNDAANVFITLSARNLNPSIEIVARGDAVSTERKLRHAGANKVVLPTHIGAERIAEIILYPETARFIRDSEKMKELDRSLRNLGLAMEVVVAPENGALTGLTIEEAERRVNGRFFVVQLNRAQGEPITQPDKSLKIEAGDGVVIVGRGGDAIGAAFSTPIENIQAGRMRIQRSV
ncbi:Inner membrane protein YbaL [Methyloligella halotolerans]|uniref:Inner membrane protein YbaL n=1 Tax=Methyloligella halotolerans TaxID=1177755 RepID=A0A1E2RYX8_9HYPH|nr:potassium channel family protein [Methyloligella halotolerans]ODA67360.1 Inner membrane protein YbaL [Methyloligella halotolerans]